MIHSGSQQFVAYPLSKPEHGGVPKRRFWLGIFFIGVGILIFAFGVFARAHHLGSFSDAHHELIVRSGAMLAFIGSFLRFGIAVEHRRDLRNLYGSPKA